MEPEDGVLRGPQLPNQAGKASAAFGSQQLSLLPQAASTAAEWTRDQETRTGEAEQGAGKELLLRVGQAKSHQASAFIPQSLSCPYSPPANGVSS